MSDLRKELETASYSCDISKIAEILAEGADINELEHGDTVLTDTISHLFDHPRRYEIVKFLLDKGADPNLGEEGCGPLFQAILHMDAEMIELLCTHGANPNLDIEGEALYDYAIFDYDYEIYDLKLPEDSNEDDEKDEDSWLGYLQRLAEKYNNKEPKHLFVLRKFGAKSRRESEGKMPYGACRGWGPTIYGYPFLHMKINSDVNRKFEVNPEKFPGGLYGEFIRQGYLSTQKERVVHVRTEGENGYITFKSFFQKSVKHNYEFIIPFSEAENLIENVCMKPLIEKMRFTTQFEGFTWKVDQFLGANEGLWSAEAEIRTEKDYFAIPDWIERDVTHSPYYYNSNLVTYPFQEWDAA